MLRNRTTRNLLSNEKKQNKFHWLYNVKDVDQHLEQGWEYHFPNLAKGKYSIDEFSEYLKTYSQENPDLGPIEISIRFDGCDNIQEVSLYHKTPHSPQDIEDLKARRREALDSESEQERKIVQAYWDLLDRKPQWSSQKRHE